MALLLVKTDDSEELLTIPQETLDTIENLILTAVDTDSDWDVIEDVLDKLINKGRVDSTMAVIDFKAKKPNFTF
ncbi:MAG: hypothetical protein DRJ15_17800 [Bacteroidetes bacterium]|nr:MAG: hypothetical protein DRJ15_17800 [Bacteroidota bacterium]